MSFAVENWDCDEIPSCVSTENVWLGSNSTTVNKTKKTSKRKRKPSQKQEEPKAPKKPKPTKKTIGAPSAIYTPQTEPTPEKPKIKKQRILTAQTEERVKDFFRSNRISKKKSKDLSLRERMLVKLKASRFRYINEQMYTKEGNQAQEIFRNDPEAFCAYHLGYQQQLSRWPINPLDAIIDKLRKMPKSYKVADFGCGEAKLATAVEQKVHSFDFMAANDHVTACDMAHVPLKGGTVDVAVFCLSLMGTNLRDYILEANRVLKNGGIMKIVEVESRFDSIENFVEGVERFGFKKVWMDLSHNLFYFMDFVKERDVKKKNKLPTISLHPCLYKKR